jgi:hypothetical protein
VDSRRLGLATRYHPGLEVTYGSATIRVDNGSIDTNESLPSPTTRRAGPTRSRADRTDRSGGRS